MKRSQRAAHVWLWRIMAPALVVLIAAAIYFRPAAPVNDALPDASTVSD